MTARAVGDGARHDGWRQVQSELRDYLLLQADVTDNYSNFPAHRNHRRTWLGRSARSASAAENDMGNPPKPNGPYPPKARRHKGPPPQRPVVTAARHHRSLPL